MKKIFRKIPFLKIIALVLWQDNDFKKFKKDIKFHFNELKKRNIQPNEKQSDTFLNTAIRFLGESTRRKEKFSSDWRTLVPTLVAGLVYVLFKKDDFEEGEFFYIAKYTIILLGIFSSWFGAVTVSLRGQEISFTRSAIRQFMSLKKEEDFCFYTLVDQYFDNDHGLNSKYRSATRIQINQMIFGGVAFIVLCIYFLIKDYASI